MSIRRFNQTGLPSIGCSTTSPANGLPLGLTWPEQNGEIKGARSFQNQLVIILGSLIVTGLLLALLAYAFEHAIGTEFLTSSSIASNAFRMLTMTIAQGVVNHTPRLVSVGFPIVPPSPRNREANPR